MYWTQDLATYLENVPWPATKNDLIDFSLRSGAPLTVCENLEELQYGEQLYYSIEDTWPDYSNDNNEFLSGEDNFWLTPIVFMI